MERNLYDIPGVSDFDEGFPIMVYPGWHASGDTPKGAMEAYPSFEDRQPRQGMAWIHRRLKEVDATVGSYWTARQEVYGVTIERRYIFEASWMNEKGVSAFLKDQSAAKRALAALTEQEKALVDLEKARTLVRYPGEMFLGITSTASGFPREFFSYRFKKMDSKICSSIGEYLPRREQDRSSSSPEVLDVYWDSEVGWMRAAISYGFQEERCWRFLTVPEVLDTPLRRFTVVQNDGGANRPIHTVEARSPMNAVRVACRKDWVYADTRFTVEWDGMFPAIPPESRTYYMAQDVVVFGKPKVGSPW